MKTNLKNFVGEYAYNIIKNITVNSEAIRNALITPQNARAVFSELSEFDIKSLCFEISTDGTIGQVKESTQEEITETFKLVGYDTVIFDNEAAILECRKYYRPSEVICTYNSLQSRMREYHMLVAIKANVDKIERSKSPSREDEYGTSILNIQIAKNGSHMSIKNRYNHTVDQPDSTLGNNLDRLHLGLQSMVLGYYGLASLNKTKAHYNNIVNIGGVYLKYHTEKNNVYFGSFVLDGINGVRFTDSSRYYVTKEQGRNSYYKYPLILDFKNKQAIDVCQNNKKINSKAPLISKAMRGGILTSANKSDADTITAVFHNAKKELLQSNRNALKYLHEVYGYDFTKPYKVTGLLGKFTVKSIEKATGESNGILLICEQNDIKVCEMGSGRFFAKDLHSSYKYDIDKFYSQGDFEIARKTGCLGAYVIQQEKQYIGTPKPEERTSYSYGQRNNRAEFDKSGCNITETRELLLQKLKQYKTENRAREAAEVDYSKDILEISELFSSLKKDIVDRLVCAETSKDYETITGVTNYELTWLVRDIEEVKKKALNKSFSSLESAQNMIGSVKAKILKLEMKLG